MCIHACTHIHIQLFNNHRSKNIKNNLVHVLLLFPNKFLEFFLTLFFFRKVNVTDLKNFGQGLPLIQPWGIVWYREWFCSHDAVRGWEPLQEQADRGLQTNSVCAFFRHIIAAWLEATSLTHLNSVFPVSFLCKSFSMD